MEYQFIGIEGFIDDLSSSEQYLFIFSANREKFESLSDFGYACAFEEYQRTAEFFRETRKKHPVPGISPWDEQFPWEKYRERFIQCPLAIRMFFEKLKFCIEGLKNPLPIIKEENIKSAMILEDEWNSVFVVAELPDSFVGYWWQTSA